MSLAELEAALAAAGAAYPAALAASIALRGLDRHGLAEIAERGRAERTDSAQYRRAARVASRPRLIGDRPDVPLGPPVIPPTGRAKRWRDYLGRYTWSPGASDAEIAKAKAAFARKANPPTPATAARPASIGAAAAGRVTASRIAPGMRLVVERHPVDVVSNDLIPPSRPRTKGMRRITVRDESGREFQLGGRDVGASTTWALAPDAAAAPAPRKAAKKAVPSKVTKGAGRVPETGDRALSEISARPDVSTDAGPARGPDRGGDRATGGRGRVRPASGDARRRKTDGDQQDQGGHEERRSAGVPAGGGAGRDRRTGGDRQGDSVDLGVFGGARDRSLDPVYDLREGGAWHPPTAKARLDANIDALETVLAIRARPRDQQFATTEEQAILARWSSWGALAGVFDEPPRDARFARAQALLKQTLTDDEYKAANATIINAHYTDPALADAMWGAFRELLGPSDDGDADGSRKWQVVEPGSGSGTFIGMIPPDLREHVHMTGVELDSTTAMIAQLLYPDMDIRHESYAETTVADGAFDGAIGNVPFSTVKLYDPDDNPGSRYSMHNHFIIKSLKKAAPGAPVVILTSRFTMDSLDEASRREMMKYGDFLGAVRLPTGAHRETAGTDVVTDVLVFRRRGETDKEGFEYPYRGEDFLSTSAVEMDDGQGGTREVSVNDYFQQNPRMVLGSHQADKTAKKDYYSVVDGPDDVPAALTAALGRIVDSARRKGLIEPVKRSDPPTFKLPASRTVDPGQGLVTVHRDRMGRPTHFTRRIDGVDAPFDVPASERKEVAALVEIREQAMMLHRMELVGGDDESDDMKAARQRLNDLYDAYVDEYGFVHRYTEQAIKPKKSKAKAATEDDLDEDEVDEDAPGVRRVSPPAVQTFRRDFGSAFVRVLEAWDDKAKTGSKRGLLVGRMTRPRKLATSASTGREALAMSMEELGVPDLGRMGELLGTDEEGTRAALRMGTTQALVFETLSGDLVPRRAYLSGNVRRRYRELRDAVDRMPGPDRQRYQGNIDALERAVPPDVDPSEITIQMGAPWIGPTIIQGFLRHLFRDPTVSAEVSSTGRWKITGDKSSSAANDEWGVPRTVDGLSLVQQMLTMYGSPEAVSVTVRKSDDTVDVEASQARTVAAQAKAAQIEAEFASWLWTSEYGLEVLARYNDWNNSVAHADYSDVTSDDFPTLMAKMYRGEDGAWMPHAHQWPGLAKMLDSKAFGLFWDAGMGKTFAMQAGALMLRDRGLVRRPAMLVPDHMLEQATREFAERFPTARILAVSHADLRDDKDGSKLREIVAQASTGDWDCVILTHSAFTKIPVSGETEMAYRAEEVAKLREAVVAATERVREQAESVYQSTLATQGKMAASKARDRVLKGATTAKQLQTRILALEQKIKKRQDEIKRRGDLPTFESMGIDYLFVDEAHLFKNLPFSGGRGGLQVKGSQRAIDLDMKLGYLRSRHDRVVTLATGTPVSNTILEAYVMLHHLAPDMLEDIGIRTADDFLATFGELVTDLEVAPTGGGMRTTSRIKRFKNLADLMQVYLHVASVLDAEDSAKIVKRPSRKEWEETYLDEDGDEHVRRSRSARVIEVEPGPKLAELLEEIAHRWDTMPRVPEPGDDNPLSLISLGKVAASTGVDGEDGKLERVAREAAARYQGYYIDADGDVVEFPEVGVPYKDRIFVDGDGKPMGEPGAAQIMFLDVGSPTTEASSTSEIGKRFPTKAYHKLRAALVAQGVPARKIAFIQDAKTDEEKAALFEDVRTGRIHILIGSRAAMGVGTNVQDRLTMHHDIDVAWKSSDNEQAQARTLRSGNRSHKWIGPDGTPSPNFDDDVAEVEVQQYVTVGSLDGYVNQLVANKAAAARQVSKGTVLRGQVVEDIGEVTMTARTAAAAASGSRYITLFTDAQNNLARLKARKSAHLADRELKRRAVVSNERRISQAQETAAVLSAVADKVTPGNPWDSPVVTVGDRTYRVDPSRVAAAQTARDAAGWRLAEAKTAVAAARADLAEAKKAAGEAARVAREAKTDAPENQEVAAAALGEAQAKRAAAQSAFDAAQASRDTAQANVEAADKALDAVDGAVRRAGQRAFFHAAGTVQAMPSGQRVAIGEMQGLTVRAENTRDGVLVTLGDGRDGPAAVSLYVREDDWKDPEGKAGAQFIRSLRQSALAIPNRLTAAQAEVAELTATNESLRARIIADGGEWPFEDELASAQARFDRLKDLIDAEMKAKGIKTPTADATQEAEEAADTRIAAIERNLEAGGGFDTIDELSDYLAAADEKLAEAVDNLHRAHGTRWATLTPGGKLIVVKGSGSSDDKFRVVVPRTLRQLGNIGQFNTQRDAKEFAEALEGTGVPWNTGVDLDSWRDPATGRDVMEIAALLRASNGRWDPKREFGRVAAELEVARRVPKRLQPVLGMKTHEPLGRLSRMGVSGYRNDESEKKAREQLLAILERAPADNLALADQLRTYALGEGNPYEGRRIASDLVTALDRDFHKNNPAPLDIVRRDAFGDGVNFYVGDRLRDEEELRARQILNQADASGDYQAAVAALRARADELVAAAQSKQSYERQSAGREADRLRNIATKVANLGSPAEAAIKQQFSAAWDDAYGAASGPARIWQREPTALIADARKAYMAGDYTTAMNLLRRLRRDYGTYGGVVDTMMAVVDRARAGTVPAGPERELVGARALLDALRFTRTFDPGDVEQVLAALTFTRGAMSSVDSPDLIGAQYGDDDMPWDDEEDPPVYLMAEWARQTRAAGHDITPGHDELHHYWTKGEGLAKWADAARPWTTLVAHLTKHVGARKAKIFASRWFIEVFGYAAGSDKNRVAHGLPPRGKKIGPG